MFDPWLVPLAAVAPEALARPMWMSYWDRMPYWKPVPYPEPMPMVYRERVPVPWPMPMPYREPMPVPVPYREPPPCPRPGYCPPPPMPGPMPPGGQWMIRPGDSFWGIARAVGTTPEMLMALNPWYEACNLPIGGMMDLP